MTAPSWLTGRAGRELYAGAAKRRPDLADAGYRARADRPSRRRCAEDEQSPARVSVRVRDLQVREAGTTGLQFRGYASVTEAGYEMWDWAGPYTELVSVGAFGATLARGDLDVPLVLQHEDLRRIARTTNGSLHLAEDDHGLLVEADLDGDDLDVQYIVPKLRSGLIDEMSFKFRINSGQWSPDWMEYHINEVDIHRGDVAIVGYGASPHTAGSGLRSGVDVDAVLRGLDDEQAKAALAALTARLGAPAPQVKRALITDEDTRLRVL
ncbi:HK97 family phage prohead protease [Lentzea sp. BCCO 10_0798]|uniref:HK97 family phage prohead protease n=1 Tax=Lentzea kristufekii TaxID=3095430 RepID=A0ABU4TQ43_9PSEU|nr:HK97 family phage prohead protease [Lentzea sp. BCCO 10_0798]MDX8050409.1 HK97 family phage prohead protease [Lentzea sp. BCCO 10_0798]